LERNIDSKKGEEDRKEKDKNTENSGWKTERKQERRKRVKK
jgi:hypothetical protein